MTCIVGLVDKGVVYVGGDSAGTNDWFNQTIRADTKVFRNGEFIFGFCGSFRMGQLLRFSFSAPYHRPDVDTYRYMVTEFIDSVRDCLKRGGYARNDSGEESGGTFIVGYRGRLFVVEGDYQVGEGVENFAAVGSGADLALGAMHVTRSMGPKERIELALSAAERFNAGVRGPFVIESLSKEVD